MYHLMAKNRICTRQNKQTGFGLYRSKLRGAYVFFCWRLNVNSSITTDTNKFRYQLNEAFHSFATQWNCWHFIFAFFIKHFVLILCFRNQQSHFTTNHVLPAWNIALCIIWCRLILAHVPYLCSIKILSALTYFRQAHWIPFVTNEARNEKRYNWVSFANEVRKKTTKAKSFFSAFAFNFSCSAVAFSSLHSMSDCKWIWCIINTWSDSEFQQILHLNLKALNESNTAIHRMELANVDVCFCLFPLAHPFSLSPACTLFSSVIHSLRIHIFLAISCHWKIYLTGIRWNIQLLFTVLLSLVSDIGNIHRTIHGFTRAQHFFSLQFCHWLLSHLWFMVSNCLA